jgi:hypothetical protein
MEKLTSVIGELIKDPRLLLVLIGLFFFLIGALGQWPGSQGTRMEDSWRLVLAGAGAVLAGGFMVPLWRQLARINRKTPGIEGDYHVENNPEYEISFKQIPKREDLYTVRGKSWDGVGILQGNFYYGIYKYHSGSDLSDLWGAHKAEVLKDGGLKFFLVELSNKHILRKDEELEFTDNRVRGDYNTWRPNRRPKQI